MAKDLSIAVAAGSNLVTVPRRFNPGIKEAILFALDNGIAYWTNVAVISPIVVSVSGILKNLLQKNYLI